LNKSSKQLIHLLQQSKNWAFSVVTERKKSIRRTSPLLYRRYMHQFTLLLTRVGINFFHERVSQNENNKFFSGNRNRIEKSCYQNANDYVCKLSRYKWSKPFAVTSWSDSGFPCSSSLLLMKERHSKSWMIQDSIWINTKKASIFSKSISKSVLLRNVTIYGKRFWRL
jgi:hypothetical protein